MINGRYAQMLAILAPTATELGRIQRVVGRVGVAKITLHVSGIGRSATLRACNKIAAWKPDAIIMTGFCGATDPELNTGDLHIAGTFIYGEEAACLPSDLRFQSTLLSVATSCELATCAEPSATIDHVADAAEKAALRDSLGVASVNMEDYWAAGAAARAGIPFVSLRAVLDTARESLPPFLSDGNKSSRRIVWDVVMKPARTAGTVRLARQAHLARRNLARCIFQAISSNPLCAVAQPAGKP